MRESSGYKVVATEALSAHNGSVAIFCWTAEHLSVESFQYHRDNVVSFHLASGYRPWYIGEYYLAPDDTPRIEDVVTEIIKRIWGDSLQVVGNLNTGRAAPDAWDQDEGISAALVEDALEDMSSDK